MDSYNQIYERMKNEYIAQGCKSFDEASDVAIRLRVLAGEIFKAETNAEWLKNQMFFSTASGIYLDYFAMQRGLQRKPAEKAQGEITFFINDVRAENIFIPKGTIVATSDANPVRFVTTEDEFIAAGNTLVSVYCEAENGGSSGNALIGNVNVMVNVPSDIDYAYNREDFVGGIDEESDEELRKRIKDTFTVLANGTNSAYYKKLALSVNGVTKVGVLPRVRGTGTVDVYVSNGDGSLSSNTVAMVQNIISKNRELNVNVLVAAAQKETINLSVRVMAKEGYIASDVQNICREIFEKYIEEIDIGGSFYLAELGKRFMNSECIVSYEFSANMSDIVASGSQCLGVGTVSVVVV